MAGPKPWRVDTPAVFLDCDWQQPGELLGVVEPQLQIPLSMDFSMAAYVMRPSEDRILLAGACLGWGHL
eukprot:s2585_g2.t1